MPGVTCPSCGGENTTPKHSYCLPCYAKMNAAYREHYRNRSPEEVRAVQRRAFLKHCRSCDSTLNTSEFYRDRNTRSGYMSQCKACYDRKRKARNAV